MHLHILILYVLIHQVKSWGGAFTCEDYWTDGTYCTDDLTGYHVCTWKGGWGQRYKHTTVPCPQGTRCTCHYRYQCSVKEEDICKTFSTPKPFIDPAIFTYTGRRVYDYISPRRKDEITDFQGEIRQDIKNGRISTIRKQTHNGKSKTYFQLTVPNSIGGWRNYAGEIGSKKCRVWGYGASYKRYISKHFLGNDINKYTLLKSWMDEASNATHEKWYFKQGDYEGQYIDKFWTVKVRDGLSIPLQFTENFLESEDNTHNIYKDFYYNVTVPEVGEVTDQWFQVPEFC